MRVALSAAAAAAVIGAATLAFAADMTATGKIKSIDISKHEITLDNGSMYSVAKGVSLGKMKTGEKVTLTYNKSGKTMDATAIKPAA